MTNIISRVIFTIDTSRFRSVKQISSKNQKQKQQLTTDVLEMMADLLHLNKGHVSPHPFLAFIFLWNDTTYPYFLKRPR